MFNLVDCKSDHACQINLCVTMHVRSICVWSEDQLTFCCTLFKAIDGIYITHVLWDEWM